MKRSVQFLEYKEIFAPPPEKFGSSQEEGLEIIKGWFHRNFEPATQAASNNWYAAVSRWEWGGPYDTRTVIKHAFGDTAPSALLEVSIQALSREGQEWVPRMPATSTSEEPQESKSPAVLHGEMVEQAESLEQLVSELTIRDRHGIGHNNPPEGIASEPLELVDLNEIADALETLKEQPVTPQTLHAAEAAVATLHSKRQKVMGWFADQGNSFVEAAVKEAGKEFGKWAPRAFWLIIIDRLLGVSQAALAWLHSVAP